jgi:uncharacterized protein YggT (Ycf19 family)
MKIALKIAHVVLWLVWLWVTITIVLLFLGFFLLLFGADPTAGFVEWVYRSTQRAMAPFRGIFESITLSGDSVLDVSILFAIIVYAFVAIGLHALMRWVTGRLTAQERQEHEDAVLAAHTAATQAAGAPRASRTLQLAGPNAAAATATLTDAKAGTYIDLTTSNLDVTRQYTVWMEDETGGRLTVGTFQPASAGPSRLATASPMLLGDAKLFGVTMLGLPGEAGTDVFAARIP